jgi:hypothetical protein
VTNFAEIIPVAQSQFTETPSHNFSQPNAKAEKSLADLSQDELFEKLQNYKKLLDNGLILQGEYDAYKKEILSFM